MDVIDPNELEEQVYNASKASFARLIEENPDQNFYTFGLWTDDSLQFLHPTANTEEALIATVKNYQETVDPKYGCTSTRNGMRWSYGDWGFFPYESGGYFDEINEALLANFQREVDNEVFKNDKDPLWDAVINGFKRIDQEDFFGTGDARSKITLLLVGDLSEELVNKCVTILNPPEIAEKFFGWNYDAPDSEEG